MNPGEFELSFHARTMLAERSIEEEWLWLALRQPDEVIDAGEGKLHYVRSIPAFGNRMLRVIVNTHSSPSRVVTLYFDRALRQK